MAGRHTRHRTIAIDVDAPARSKEHRAPQWPWWVTCAAGAIAVLLAAWLLIAGAAVVASLASPETELVASLTFASKMVILAHGAPVVVAGQPISIMPLTLTFALILLGIPVTSMAARQLAANQSEPDDTGQLWLDGQSLVVRITLTFAIPYALTVSLASAQASGRHAWSALIGSFVVAVIAGLWGASHAIGHDPRLDWPAWLRSVPSALASGVLICLAGGAAAITAALILNREQVVAIHEALGPGPVGSVLLLLLQLLFLPNFALWGTSWTLGAGVTLGDGSLMNLNVSDSGFLPAIPSAGPHCLVVYQ